MKKKIIHHGNNNIRIKASRCGVLKDGDNHSTEVEKVNCTLCIRNLLKLNATSSKTPLWVERLKQLELRWRYGL